MLVAFVVVIFACAVESPVGAASAETLSPSDVRFCKGGLEVMYPELDIRECMVVPAELREKISKEWGPPRVRLADAKQKKTYTLMMVDPDAPSRKNPTRSRWRHWLVTDIKGRGLKKGQIKGTVLSEYGRPTPPRQTGFHRYQFLLYEQPKDQTPSLSPDEKTSLGNWDPKAFVKRFRLGPPVAALQFLTQNHRD
ncbi:phosphatidylethanolamine-binding protein 4 [Chanos chanos]|uniref:Phosphatidylethanolamine-binding protein 4 n=1 Tax=Chanos chanos TaxID=29144 RepID=A0A6J2UPV8_CHACN|nr:phosphatidylethanolamine-binding protein 4 [Chanos chanos]